MLHIFQNGSAAWRSLMTVGLLLLLQGAVPAAEASVGAEKKWALGWEEGMTLRYRTGSGWLFSVGGGPQDYLHKEELRANLLGDPSSLHDLLQVPVDTREEHGWVRIQAGKELLQPQPSGFMVTAFSSLTFEWFNHQERQLLLDELVHEYDTFELDRHTGRWIFALGLRPSYRVTDWFSVETAFGVGFIHDDWDETVKRTHAGVTGHDTEITDGRDQWAQDFGFDGAGAVQFFFWF